MDYFYIQNGQIIGCGQAQCLNDDIINAEVTPDMVDYNDNPTWESERFKWQWKWDGEKLIENPEFEIEEKAHYNEAMRQYNENTMRMRIYTSGQRPRACPRELRGWLKVEVGDVQFTGH